MEFYLVDDLECDLVVFHPYRTLLSLCKKEASDSSSSEEGETEDLGVGIGPDDGPRYWGTGDGQLEFTPAALQTAWSIINDSYRSQLCLLYPPHLIAIAAIYLTFILHPPTRPDASLAAAEHNISADPARRRSSRQAHNPARGAAASAAPKNPQDPIAFLAELNVSLPAVAAIAQEIISMYTLWDRYSEDVAPDAKLAARELTNSPMPSGGSSPVKRAVSRAESMCGAPGAGTPGGGGGGEGADADGALDGGHITPSFLSAVLLRMREMRVMDASPIAPGVSRPVAVNKRLERTQAAG